MPQLQWVTPTGSLANFLAGVPAEVELITLDTANNGSAITYSIIGGSLPNGMTLSSSGVISGTPEVTTQTSYDTEETYSFIVRAVSTNGYVLDGNFTIILSNTVNFDFSWITPAGDLGTIPNNQYYSLQVQTETTGNLAVTYGIISGALPYGMQFVGENHYNANGTISVAAGTLQGVPTFLNPIAVDQSQTYRFTVRATSSAGHVTDQTFSLTVTNVFGPVISPSTTNLGEFFDGSYYSQQLSVAELNPNVEIEWSITNGSLPGGVTLSSTGLLSGYIQPLELVGSYGPAGYDGDVTTDNVVTDQEEFDSAPYDFNNISQNLSYSFTVQAFDGANYDTQHYIINVVSRAGFTADSDNTSITVDNTYLTVDSTNVYTPVLLDTNTTLPTSRQDGYFAYKFQGYDFSGDTITYSLADNTGTFDTIVTGVDDGFDYAPFDSYISGGASSAVLPGLILDSVSGWLYGKLDPQSIAFQDFSIGVVVSKVVNGITYSSNPKYFTLPILGDVNNIITWVSPSNLGSINNGSVSELSVVAKSPIGKTLIYTLVDQPKVPARLPQGLTLLPSGDISGRASFETFSLDHNSNENTTFDSGTMTIDRTYTFTVNVAASDGTASATRTFTITLDVIDNDPYVNLYLQAMPAFDQRQIFNSIVSNTEIFDPSIIYRPTDPWFGVADSMNMLFLPGLNSATLDQFQTAITNNHWTKTYTFDDIKTAVVLDENYNVKYEVVYIHIVDPEETASGTGPGLKIDLSGKIANPYIDANGHEFTTIYPNTSENMIARLVDNIGYYDQSSLPPWMTSNQLSSSGSVAFSTPLGYTPAIVLAYTLPGKSEQIAYRLKSAGINFNNILFTADRYLVDNYYSTNFQNNVWVLGTQTTFDALPTTNIGTIVAQVNYAVQIPFSQINGRTVSYINANGGLDGRTDYVSGDTLIFAKQEHFLNPGPYDGWVDYEDAFIGDNITSSNDNGYDSEGFDLYTVIPGYAESNQATVTFTGTGTQKTFTTTQNFSSSVSVYVNGLIQPSANYSVSGDTITFVTAPPAPTPIKNIQVVHNADNTEDQFTGTGTQTTFTMSESAANSSAISVLINGVPQVTTSYTVSGTSLIFNTAPPAPATTPNIEVASNINERGGVWQINIVNGVVNLTFVQQINLNDRVRVINGQTYSGAILYYNPVFVTGQTVPSYSVFKLSYNAIVTPTTFNAGTTTFFSNRDQYYTPGSNDKYLKFPQIGAFN